MAQVAAPSRALVSVERIWDRAEHCAFTDLCVNADRVFVTFREGERHVHGADGLIRVIASDDRMNWRSVALVEELGLDLRDPKLSVMPDGRLMLAIGASRYVDRELREHAPRVAFGDAAPLRFTAPARVELPAEIRSGFDWLWRVTWHEGHGYGVVYHPRDPKAPLDLVRTDDGLRYALVARLEVPRPVEPAQPNETTLRFCADGTMIALVRCDGASSNGVIGTAAAPYTSFTWRTLDRRLGGPDFVVLDGDRMLAGSRAYPPAPTGPGRANTETTTALFWLDRDGTTRGLLTLPSGGDDSYPGFAIDGDRLLVSYYSGHRGSTAIHLASLRLAALRDG